ncbi:MAG: hypothetical protein ABGX41_08995, partial [Pseudohongiella sp.]
TYKNIENVMKTKMGIEKLLVLTVLLLLQSVAPAQAQSGGAAAVLRRWLVIATSIIGFVIRTMKSTFAIKTYQLQ